MSFIKTALASLALLAACHHNSGGRNGMPSAAGTPTAQNDDMNRTSSGTDVGNGTDTSGNGSPTPDPQQTQMPRCDQTPGMPQDPHCTDRSPAPPPTTPTAPDVPVR